MQSTLQIRSKTYLFNTTTKQKKTMNWKKEELRKLFLFFLFIYLSSCLSRTRWYGNETCGSDKNEVRKKARNIFQVSRLTTSLLSFDKFIKCDIISSDKISSFFSCCSLKAESVFSPTTSDYNQSNWKTKRVLVD